MEHLRYLRVRFQLSHIFKEKSPSKRGFRLRFFMGGITDHTLVFVLYYFVVFYLEVKYLTFLCFFADVTVQS